MKKLYTTLFGLILLLTPVLTSEPPEETFKSALDQENITRIQELLASYDLDVNMQNQEGNTALMLTVWKDHITLGEKLLQHPNVDVNKQDKDGYTALIFAISRKNIKLAKKLLQHNHINVNLQNGFGSTALMLAICKNHITLAEQLLQCNHINVNLQNGFGSTALMLAICRNYTTITELLLQRHDINVNLQNEEKETALIITIEKNHIKIAQLLLQRDDIDVNLQDGEKKTALAYIKHNHIDLTKPQNDSLYYVSLVKRTHIPSLPKDHILLQKTYLQMLYNQQPFTQDMAQYTDILLVNKIANELTEEQQKPLLYQACLLAYETKNSNYSIQAKDITSPQTLSHYQPILDQDLKKLLTGYLRKVNMKRVSYESDWAHYIACYLWANNQFAIEYNPNTMTLQEIHFWHKHHSPYPEWLDAANHTQERALFKIVYQKGKYQAVATKHLARGMKQIDIIQNEQQIFEQSITQCTPIIIAGIQALVHQFTT